MTPESIIEEKKILKTAILKALQDFSNKTSLKVEEISKIEFIEMVHDAGKDYFYKDLQFKVML